MKIINSVSILFITLFLTSFAEARVCAENKGAYFSKHSVNVKYEIDLLSAGLGSLRTLGPIVQRYDRLYEGWILINSGPVTGTIMHPMPWYDLSAGNFACWHAPGYEWAKIVKGPWFDVLAENMIFPLVWKTMIHVDKYEMKEDQTVTFYGSTLDTWSEVRDGVPEY